MKRIVYFLVGAAAVAEAEVPVPGVLVEGMKIELVASEPEIRTPVGIAAAANGDLYVVENNTHQVRPDYSGPKSDRIRRFRKGAGGGWEATTFAEGFRNAMVLKIDPDGVLHLTQRDKLLKLEDVDGDGDCDRVSELVRWETKGDYPHNGMSGMAWSADGWIYVGSGENLQEKYTAVGADGKRIEYTPGGANVFRVRRDGSGLEVVATGLWNGFGLTFDGAGRLFAVDNDPDSCPPNRLLEIEAGSDYGFNMAYGRAGVHPFQCWNGEIPGTRGMVSGVGEAATDVMDLRVTGFRKAGLHLMVTSWGDNQIETYGLVNGGRGLEVADRRVVVKGDAGFRPACLAAAADGSVYVTDWADREYSVHGKGRIWRLSATGAAPVRAEEAVLAKVAVAEEVMNPEVAAAVMMRRGKTAATEEGVRGLLGSKVPGAVRVAMMVAGEKRMGGLKAEVEGALGRFPADRELFRTGVAALEMMGLAEGAKPEGQIDGFLVRMVGQRELPAAVRGLAMVSLGNREAASRVLLEVLGEKDDAVAALAARALGGIGQKAVVEALRGVALDRGRGVAVRLEALGSLSGRADEELLPLLVLLEEKGAPELVREVVRTLRGAVGNGEVKAAFERLKPGDFGVQAQVAMVLGRPSPEIRPANDEQWREALRSGGGDVAAGRRVFFSAAAMCGSCHVVEGRGKAVGPDLSVIGRTVDGEKLLRSVLEPSREVGPLYGVRVATLKDGRVMSGVLAGVQDAGRLDLVNAGGAVQSALRHEVEKVETVSASLMPDGLESGLTVQEFRDLMAWLATLR